MVNINTAQMIIRATLLNRMSSSFIKSTHSLLLFFKSNTFHHFDSFTSFPVTSVFVSYVLVLPSLRPLSLNDEQHFVLNDEWRMGK